MNAITIRKIMIHEGRIPVNVRFSYGKPAAFNFVIARIFAGDWEGLGECLSGTRNAYEPLARELIGKDAAMLDGLLGEAPVSAVSWPAFQPNVVREMFSMALYDLVAKACRIPFHLLLGGARRQQIPLMPCIFAETAAAAADTARVFLDQGYGALKVKIFGKLDGDLEIIRAIRRIMPNGHLQADANHGYKTAAEGRIALQQLAEAGLTVAEDPFTGALDDYRQARAAMEQPIIMLDNPTRAWNGIYETCAKKAAHAVNLHPNMQGTFSEILGRAAVAKATGIPVMVGGTGYTGIGTFAHAQAAAVIGLEFPCGEICGARDHGMPASSAAPMLPVNDGAFTLSDEPGHGGKLNLGMIEKYSTYSVELP